MISINKIKSILVVVEVNQFEVQSEDFSRMEFSSTENSLQYCFKHCNTFRNYTYF